jgi:hypothetical protein
VHHVNILGKWPTWRTILFCVFIFNSLYVSSTSCSSPGETNCVNTTSGSCQSMSVAVSCDRSEVHFRPVTRRWHWQLPEVVLTQFVSPDDEHDVLETYRELKINTQKRIVRQVGHLPRIIKTLHFEFILIWRFTSVFIKMVASNVRIEASAEQTLAKHLTTHYKVEDTNEYSCHYRYSNNGHQETCSKISTSTCP